MRKHFSEFYKPSIKEIKQLWDKSIFVFDANVLLDFYRFSKTTSDLLFDIFEKLKSREQLWIPYQAGFEFHKHRVGVIDLETAEYDRLIDYFTQEFPGQAKQSFYKNCSSHPYIDTEKFMKKISKLGLDISKNIDSLKTNHPDLIKSDPILPKLTKLFDGLVGDPYDQEKLQEIYREGAERYSKRIPPGYSDSKKSEPESYGDLVFWFQIIDKAKASKKPVILITRDRKEDWWSSRKSGEKEGARKELIREIKNKAGVDFHIYEIDNFINLAAKELKIKITSRSKREIKIFLKDREEISDVGIAEGLDDVGVAANSSGIVASYVGESSLISQPIVEKKKKPSKKTK